LIQIKSLFGGKNNIRVLKKSFPMTRILVADDDNDVRTALRVALEGEGYEVETVPDGERAMQVHEKRPVDVLITDLFMPERDGFEAVQYFRARKPGMQIVVISGWQRGQKTDHLAVARHAGADAVLRKPFRLGELLEQLQSWIPRK
jgi:CheY-like chemotaxis protein